MEGTAQEPRVGVSNYVASALRDVLAKSGSVESCEADCQVPVLARSPTIVGKSRDLDKYIYYYIVYTISFIYETQQVVVYNPKN